MSIMDDDLPLAKRGKRRALVVGVQGDRDGRMSELKCPLNDAQGVETVLRERCGFEVTCLTSENATTEQIKNSIYALAEFGEDGEEDEILLFYFSGHGMRVVDYEEVEDTYLVARDFNRRFVYRNSKDFLSTRWLRDQLYLKTKARQVVLVLDCCYSGMIGATGENPGRSDIERLLRRYLKEVAEDEVVDRKVGMRGALCAVPDDREATEGEKYSLMTGHMLELLRGEAARERYTKPILLESVMEYLRQELPEEGQPVWCGLIDQRVVLAEYHNLAQNVEAERNRERELRALGARTLPEGFMYVPVSLNRLFKREEQDFPHLENLLFSGPDPARVGLVGMPGIGKSQLAAQLAYAYHEHFPRGIFWVEVQGKSEKEWRASFVALARTISYLPPGGELDDESVGRYMLEYLATNRALLILDGVPDAKLVLSMLPKLMGREPACTVLYTSTDQSQPDGVETYPVTFLSRQAAQRLLLENVRTSVLERLESSRVDKETQAFDTIYNYLQGHPLSLVALRALLKRDSKLSVNALIELMVQQDILDLSGRQPDYERTLRETFRLLWNQLEEKAQEVFVLASQFREGAVAPVWLVGLAAGLGEDDHFMKDLYKFALDLRDCSLLDYVSSLEATGESVFRLHSLARKFGQQQWESVAAEKKASYVERIVNEFGDMQQLSTRAARGYWRCMNQAHSASEYVAQLNQQEGERVAPIAQALVKERELLSDRSLWPGAFPGLFYQQMYKRSLNEGWQIKGASPTAFWLKQYSRVEDTNQGIEKPPEEIFKRHRQEVRGVAFAPESEVREIATASQDGNILLINDQTGETLTTLAVGHGVLCIAYAPDGLHLAAGCEDGSIRIWRWERALRQAQLKHILRGHKRDVHCIAWSPDGSLLASGGQDWTVKVWEWEKGAIKWERCPYERDVVSVAFSPQGGQIVSGSWDGRAHLWSTESGEELQCFHYNLEMTWVDSAQERLFEQREMYHNPLTGQDEEPTGVLEKDKRRAVECLLFAPGGKEILAGYNDATIRLWDIVSGGIVRTLIGHEGEKAVKALALVPSGELVVSAGYDRTARTWRISDGQLLATYLHLSTVNCVAVSPDGERFMTGANDKAVRIWRLSAEEQSDAVLTTSAREAIISAMTCAGQGQGLKLLSGDEDGNVILRRARSGDNIWKRKLHTSTVIAVAFCANERCVISGGYDGNIWLGRAQDGKGFQKLWEHTYPIISVVASSDGETILGAAANGELRSWRIRASQQPTKVWRHYQQQERSALSCAIFSSSGHAVIAGTAQGEIIFWEVRSTQEKQRIQAHEHGIYTLACAPDDSICVSSGLDRKAYVWNLETYTRLQELDTHNMEIGLFSFSPNGQWLAGCDVHSGRVWLWRKDESRQYKQIGVYEAYRRVGQVLWSGRSLFLVDMGGAVGKPNYYLLTLENRV